MSDTFFSSDMHFGHKNIIKYCNRPCASTEEMEVLLVERHNKLVKPTDVWFHLGDFAFLGAGHQKRILGRLNGTKCFLPGNHDNLNLLNECASEGLIQSIVPHWIGKLGKHHFHMYHYPIESWINARHGTIHLHGHSHGTTPSPNMLRKDVGVDCNNLSPFSYEEIAAWADALKENLKGENLDPGRSDRMT